MTPINEEHIEAKKISFRNSWREMYKLLSPEDKKKMDAVKQAMKLLSDNDVPFIMFPFLKKRVDFNPQLYHLVEMPIPLDNFDDQMKFLDSGMADEESLDLMEDYQKKILYTLFMMHQPIDGRPPAERLDDFAVDIEDAWDYVGEQIRGLIE